MSEFEYNSERDILASVLHAADKFCLQTDGHGDEQLLLEQQLQIAPLLKRISNVKDVSTIQVYPVHSSEDDDDEDDSEDKDDDEDDVEQIKLIQGLDVDTEAELEKVIADELIEDIFYVIYKFQNDAIDVIDGTFVSTMFKDLSKSVVTIPRSMGLHDIHSSKRIAIPVIPTELDNDPSNSLLDESVTDIIEYCFSEAAAKVASDELGVPLIHSKLTDRVEGVGMSQSMCSTYKMQKSPSRGAWARIKKVFSSFSGRSSK